MRKNLLAVVVFAGVCLPALLHAQSSLEVPQAGAFQSGLGYISGWKCSGGNLTFTIDNGPPGSLAYGISRGDTQGTCGDSNNGFISQFNWNLLTTGQHTIRVFDNGQQFAEATFTSTNLGTEFLSGASGSVQTTLAGKNLTLTWQQNQQNYAVTAVSGGEGGSGEICETKNVTIDEFGDKMNFSMTNPCTGKTLTISFTPTTADGFFVCVDLNFVQAGVQYDEENYEWVEAVTQDDVCERYIQGVTVNTVLTAHNDVPLDFNQPFSVYFNTTKLFDFP